MQLGLGTAAIGRPQYINIKPEAAQEALNLVEFEANGLRLLDFAYAKGIRYFDTAPGYGFAENMLMKWLATIPQKVVTVGTKWGYTYVANFKRNATVHEVKELSLAKLNEQWIISQALIPYLKYYQVHSATLESGVLEHSAIHQRLHELKHQHNLTIGITTSGENQLEILQKAAAITVEGKPLFDSYQVTFNIFDQSLVEAKETLKGKQVIVKEALANGRIFRNEDYPHYDYAYQTLEALSKKHHVGTDAIALRFAMQSFPASLVLSGASDPTQLTQNLLANHTLLDENDMTELAALKVKTTNYWSERKQLAWN